MNIFSSVLVSMRMFARYMLEGSDYTGAACHTYIENNGWFDNGSVPATFRTVPTFITDSPALAPYLHRNCFVGEGTPDEQGVVIRLYEVLEEQNRKFSPLVQSDG